MQPIEINKNIYWVGALDWDIRDFHGYSTPQGTTYNAYLVIDDKVTLFDTVKKGHGCALMDNIKRIIDPAKIDYIVVNHVEPDHSGSLPEVMDIVKPEKVFCSSNGKKALLAHYHRDDWPYEVVSDGQTLSLGSKTVHFLETRMLHWPDSMFSYIEQDKLLISQDAFGEHWATTERFDDEMDQSKLMHEAAKYYANILLLYSPLVQKLLARVSEMGLEIDIIAPDHGVIWRANPGSIIEAWGKWSRQETKDKALVVYDTMWHSTESMAHAIAEGLAAEGISVKVINMQFNHRSDVATEMLDAKAILFGSATINNGMLPRMADVISYVKGLRPANKIGAAFGSYGWGGEAVKLLNAAMEEMKFDIIDPGIRVNYVPTQADIAQCVELGRKVGKAILS